MYTWGYIKEACLDMLNLTEEEANHQKFLSRFPLFANQAMTQICGSIKPDYRFHYFKVTSKEEYEEAIRKFLVEKLQTFRTEHGYVDETTELEPEDLIKWNKKKEWLIEDFRKKHVMIGDEVTMPDEFTAFDDDIVLFKQAPIWFAGQVMTTFGVKEAQDEDLLYRGHNKVIPLKAGEFDIPYKARWIFFKKDFDNHFKLGAPADVLDCLPSYIVSQCLKIDDEQKAAIYRNEYELFLGRIDDTHFKRQRTLEVAGGW